MIQSLHEQPRGFVVRPIHASDLERKAERFRQILADIDFALTIEIEKLERREGDLETVPALIEILKEAHQKRRDPYVRKLAELAIQPADKPAMRHGGPLLAAASPRGFGC